jgi:micrococcal nuclease
MVITACGGAKATGSRAPSTARPSASHRIGLVTPRASATAKPTPDPNALAVKVTAHTKSVRRGGTASVTAKTTGGAECGISVEYPTGPSTARGLEPAKAPKSGAITWTWKVASNTPKGTWPVVVSCTIGDRYGETKTSFAVK